MSDEALWSVEFPITSVTRADLISAGFTDDMVASLTDEEITELASLIEDVYCDLGSWEDVQLYVDRIFKRRVENLLIDKND